MNKKILVIIAFICVFLLGVWVGGHLKTRPSSYYDCLKLGSDLARASCGRVYFPN